MQLVLRSQIGTLCLCGSGADDPTTVSSTRAAAWAMAARSRTLTGGSRRTKSRKPQTRTGKSRKMENAKTPTDTDHGKSTATHIANEVGSRYKHFDETSLQALASHRDTAQHACGEQSGEVDPVTHVIRMTGSPQSSNSATHLGVPLCCDSGRRILPLYRVGCWLADAGIGNMASRRWSYMDDRAESLPRTL